MPSLAMIATAAGGGRAVAAKPTLTHYTVTGQFQIINYDANLTYTLSVTAGTATRTNGIITMSDPNSVCTVTARLPKSIADSSAATAERKAYTGVPGPADVSYVHPPPQHGVINYGSPIGARWTYCIEASYGGECPHQEGTNVKASTPAGYTDSYNEWWKVT